MDTTTASKRLATLAATLAADVAVIALALTHHPSWPSTPRPAFRTWEDVVACQLFDLVAVTVLRAALVVWVVVVTQGGREHGMRASFTHGFERGQGRRREGVTPWEGRLAHGVLLVFHASCSLGLLGKAVVLATVASRGGACGRASWGAQGLITCGVLVGWVQVEMTREPAVRFGGRRHVGRTDDDVAVLLGARGGGSGSAGVSGSVETEGTTRRSGDLGSLPPGSDDGDDVATREWGTLFDDGEAVLGDRDWPCAPKVAPEPWREGVPEDLQRVVEDAFATLASRVRALLDEVHYDAVDETVRGRPFVPIGDCRGALSEGGRVRAWRQLAQSENPVARPPVFLTLMDAPVGVVQMERAIADPAVRTKWDPSCTSGRITRRYNSHCQTTELVFRYPFPFIERRDLQLITAKRVLRNGGAMYVAASLPPEHALPAKKGTTRAWLYAGGHYVSPRAAGCDGGTPVPWDGTGLEEDPEKLSVMVVSMSHMNLGKSVQQARYSWAGLLSPKMMEKFRQCALQLSQ